MRERILVIRTDRIGEVLLTTPILTALKERWPDARISMMVSPVARELIEGNPNVDEIIEYKKEIRIKKDKKGIIRDDKISGDSSQTENSGLTENCPHKIKEDKEGVMRKALKLRRLFKTKGFDIAIIVNPKKEFHLAAFLAWIPTRVGFDRKWGFLLTHKVKDLKFQAKKHEIEYNLDLVRALGIEPRDKPPVLVVKNGNIEIGIKKDKEEIIRDDKISGDSSQTENSGLTENCPHKIKEGQAGVIRDSKGRGIIAIHPCTSNSKKQWLLDNFARLGDMLLYNGCGVAIVCGPDETGEAKKVIGMMKNKPIDLAGRLTLKELAGLLKGCKFLISGDSGPVHIAAAVGTPVVALFGKEDPGSRPLRWGPYGEGHIIIEKERLRDITPEEVFEEIKVKIKKDKEG